MNHFVSLKAFESPLSLKGFFECPCFTSLSSSLFLEFDNISSRLVHPHHGKVYKSSFPIPSKTTQPFTINHSSLLQSIAMVTITVTPPDDGDSGPGSGSNPRPTVEQTYSRLLQKGATWQTWLSNPRSICSIPRAKLTLDFNGRHKVTVDSHPNRPPEDSELQVLKRHGLPIHAELFRHHTIGGSFASRSGQLATVLWDGYTAPGMVMIKLISRENPEKIPGVPFMADLTYAACEKASILKSVKHIYFVLIVNDETLAVFRQVYSKMARGAKYQGEHRWEAGTPEYQAFLGSPLGSMVAAFVLASFNRGTRRVSRFVTWYEGAAGFEWMRADIEAV